MTDRNYDINEFDWEGETEAIAEQEHVEGVESLIREALSVATPLEDRWLRPSKVDEDRARVQYNVPYVLTDEQKTLFKDSIGDLRTVTFNASGYHDHPMSHCFTEISEDLVVRGFKDEPFVAVWGNQRRHARMGHVGAKVVSERIVPHDWFRNRGCDEVVTRCDDFLKGRGHTKYRLFLATHSLYYMSLEDVARWMSGNPDAEFHAIIHRHDKSHGHLNKGELKYTVDSDGTVHQTNPLTGMTYSHKSMEPLFHADSCRLFNSTVGLAWDINRLAGDNYHVKFVLCDPRRCAKVEDPWKLIKTDRNVVIKGDVTVYRVLGYEWYVYNSNNGEVVLEDVELYDRLRRTIAGKERTPRARGDLMAMCRRLANKNDIISIHQGFAHEVPPQMMTYYVQAAFYHDVTDELEIAIRYHRENKKAVDALNRYYVEGQVPPDFTQVAKVGRAVAAPFTTLAGLLHDHTIGARYSMLCGDYEGQTLADDVKREERTKLVTLLNNECAEMLSRHRVRT